MSCSDRDGETIRSSGTDSRSDLEALAGWRARIDCWVRLAGILVANLGLAAQAGGFVLAYLLEDPISGYAWLERGFWLAGIGGAGMAYGAQVDAGGSVKVQCGPVTYEPPARRWPAALSAIFGIPIWAVLSLPIGILLYGILAAGAVILGAIQLARLLRPTRTG